MNHFGKKEWMIPDGFISSHSTNQVSHDAVCVLNTTDTDAVIRLTLYFENAEPMTGFEAVCPARRTHHIRMDRIMSEDGKTVPRDTPYAILVQSSVEIAVQYSRLDTSAPEMALMTTMAYPL